MFYDDAARQEEQLVQVLEDLTTLGFRGSDIAVVSSRSDDSCVAASVQAGPWRDRLRPRERASEGQIGYCTIHSFKGLEAAAVVVTDVESIDTPRDRALLYVATTRALQRLYVIAHARIRNEAVGMLSAMPQHDLGESQ